MTPVTLALKVSEILTYSIWVELCELSYNYQCTSNYNNACLQTICASPLNFFHEEGEFDVTAKLLTFSIYLRRAVSLFSLFYDNITGIR